MVGGMKRIIRFVRSHLLPVVAAVTVAVVLIGGVLTLTLVGTGGSGGAAAASTAPTTSTTAAPAAPAAAGHRKAAKGVKGQVTAINGTTWTVASAKGTAVTVDVTATTAFGTPTAPLTPAAFKVGDQIVVVGTRTKAAVAATRIALAPAASSQP
jgi:Domain of unknown function (DUF5666)